MVTYKTWEDAVAAIGRAVSPCDEQQRQLASVVGVTLPEELPRVVAAARLQSVLAEPLGLTLKSSSESQLEWLEDLATEAGEFIPSPETSTEAKAWVSYFFLKRREEALRELQLNKGDLVHRNGSSSEVDEVVSIGDNGAVYFSGGGARAWPDQLAVAARSSDGAPAAQQARRAAANRASERSQRQEWSTAKAAALEEYAVPEPLQAEDVEAFRNVLETAGNERPLQKLFEQRPRILASLLRGPHRYCRPQVRFGDKYVADFLLAEVDSNGVRWILVELETPDSDVTLARSNQFDEHARKGISQIEEWREWLQDNLDQARRARADNGIGLPDIRPQAAGLVVVGRRDRLRKHASKLRKQEEEKSRIEVCTYDRLIERLEGTLGFSGPWAGNPYKL